MVFRRYENICFALEWFYDRLEAREPALGQPLKGTIANDKGEDKGILIYKGTRDSRASSVYIFLQSEKASSPASFVCGRSR